jgi:hypothetical protein
VIRLLPAAIVALLLALSTLLPARGAIVKPPARLDSYAANACGTLLQNSEGGIDYTRAPGSGVWQPLAVSGNVASCSLTVDPFSYGSNATAIYQWDPNSLTPDPTTVALRTFSTSVTSQVAWGYRNVADPPIVMQTGPGVADPPHGPLMMDFRNLTTFFGTVNTLHLQPDGPTDLPEALEFTIGGTVSPIAGPHPVLSHAICGGDATTQAMLVAQSVMTADARLDSNTFAFAQKFRVPRTIQLLWVEVALANTTYHGTLDQGSLYLFDATNQSVPPTGIGTSLYYDPFLIYMPGIAPLAGVWVTFAYGAGSPLLLANNDYWLRIITVGDYTPYSKVLTGSESADFKERIGPLFSESVGSGPWSAVPGRALSFRLIGVPVGTLGVPPPARGVSSPRLTVTPNPARGAALVRWSGAAGTMWLDVFDARGRRVARAEGANGGTGEWRWAALDASGRALPAGVYFVRGTDDAGRVASQRLVLIR